MREILFRGKRKDDGAWIEGGICQTEGWTSIFAVNDFQGSLYEPPSCTVEDIEVIPETVGQFTSLTDKNGRRIFEGDICLCDRNINDYIDNKTFLVDFDPLFGWIGISQDGCSTFDGISWSSAEVIGNVHDNPELLKERAEQ